MSLVSDNTMSVLQLLSLLVRCCCVVVFSFLFFFSFSSSDSGKEGGRTIGLINSTE